MNWKSHLSQIKHHTGLNTISKSSVAPAHVEIIITVYNGYEALKKCIQSLLVHTHSKYPIYIYNDASTDSRIRPYLDCLEQQHKHIMVTHHDKNMGYLANVNQAMAKSVHDVVLLNSDTRVTAHWLTEMLHIASDECIGAVCPLSDSATILSLENHQQHRTERLQKLKGLWFEIPTAVGFCMLIKRALIQQLGGFDAYYAPGYGEECDYSMRIRLAGYHIAVAPASFVYHQGSQSFDKTADKLKQQHQKLLELRWPNYSQEVHAFIQQSPVQHIDRLIEKKKDRPKVLHVVHGLENKGGVELFTIELLQKMGSDCQHEVLTGAFRKPQYKSAVQTQLGAEIKLIELPQTKPQGFIYTHRSDLFNAVLDLNFANLLLFGQYDVVHFHSLVGIGSMLWPLICQQHKVPYALYFHDHFGLCQIYSMLTTVDGKELFCGQNHMSATSQVCQQCLQHKTKFNRIPQAEYMQHRLQIWHSIIAGSQKNYFSSHYLLKQYQLRYPNSVAKNQVFAPSFLPDRSSPRKIKSKPIKIAYLGHFTAFKGAYIFLEAQKKLQSETLIEWHIIGGVESKFKPLIEQQRIRCKGAFNSAELPELLAEIDLVVLCSLFPESYSITLSEALFAGIPVIAPKIGAFEERLHKRNGFLFEAGNSDDLAAQIQCFIQCYNDTDFLPTITYRNSTSVTDITQLETLYSKVSSASFQSFAATTNHVSAKPRHNAFQQMVQWLDAPHTLEANPDWSEPAEKLQICIIGQQKTLIEQTQRSIDLHGSDVQFIDIEALFSHSINQQKTILLLLAGTVVNDNLGNWLAAFQDARAAVGLADFALINEREQVYAPHFQQRFSWINHKANNQAVGALLINPALTHQDVWLKVQNESHNMQLLQKWIESSYELFGHMSIHYFPHYSYALMDLLWVKNFKQPPATPSLTTKSASVLTILESHLPAAKIMTLTQNLRVQKGIKNLRIMLFSNTITSAESSNFRVFPLSAEKHKQQLIKNQLSSFDAEYILFLNDNIIFNNLECLSRLQNVLTEFNLDAVSPPAAISRNNNHLLGNKLGGGLFFYGKGVVADSTFHPANHPIEHALLDEDCILIRRQAWQNVEPHLSDFSYYSTFVLSLLLSDHGYRSGLVKVPGLLKSGMPSHCAHSQINALESERSDIIKKSQQFKPPSHYSVALSSRKNNSLDMNYGTFKTPKNLPRVIGYAHDSWASGFYRVKSPLSALAATGMASVLFLPENHVQSFPTPYEVEKMQADYLLLHHCFSDVQLAHLQQFKKQLTIPIVLSIDDLLTHIPDYNPMSEKIPKNINNKLKTAFKLADRVIVSTNYLAEQYRTLANEITVIPNFISEQIWPITRNTSSFQRRLRIGWAGAGQHHADLAWLAPIIKATKDHVQWVFFGDKPDLVHTDWIEYHAPVSFTKYHEVLPSLNLDIGIAPLRDNPFNHAKSNLKLLEYGALGLAVICSDITPYKLSPAIRLNNDPDVWIECIMRLCNSPTRVQTNGNNMAQWVVSNYVLERNLGSWKSVLEL